jgi:molybdopterin converting factor small subunit
VISTGAQDAHPATTITVRLFGGLDKRLAGGQERIELDAASVHTVAELLTAVGLQPGVAGLVLVNGLHTKSSAAVAAGDLVAVFPHLTGG